MTKRHSTNPDYRPHKVSILYKPDPCGAHLMLRHYPEAIEALERLVNTMSELTTGHGLVAATYAAVERDADAKEEIQKILWTRKFEKAALD